jgi:hypothetical protein
MIVNDHEIALMAINDIVEVQDYKLDLFKNSFGIKVTNIC